jgi:YVTN family beta-propeller protein
MDLVLSRRALLLSTALLGCRRRKATGFPGYCFVANQEGRSLAVVDLSTFGRWSPVPLPDAPSEVLPHPRGSKVFALAPDSGTIFEIDVASLAVSRRRHFANRAISMMLAREGGGLWVLTREPAALLELSLDTLEPRRRIALPMPPDSFDLGADKRAAIASQAGQAVLIAALDRAAVERTVALTDEPGIVSFQQKGAQIVVGSQSSYSLTMIDATSGDLLVRLPIPIQPSHFCNADEGTLFVTGEGRDAVVIVYPYLTEIGETILAGHSPGAMAVAGRFLLVANPDANRVTALDIDSRKLAAVVEVGQEPRQIVITPDNQYALVLNQKSGDLGVIRIAALDARERARRYKSAPLFTLIPVGEKPVSAAVVTLV